MRAISMWQPHGSLLTTGAKPFETRGWATKFRGPVLIHASKRLIYREAVAYFSMAGYRAGLAPLLGLPIDFENPPKGPPCCPVRYMNAEERAELSRWIKAVPRGAFIGIGEIIDCIPTEKMTPAQKIRSRWFGDFRPGRFAWEVANVKRFSKPIPGKGHQGFFYASVNLKDTDLIEV